MFVALFFTCLIVHTFYSQTADDAFPSLTQSLEQIQLKEPETPQEFMQQLRRAETTISHNIPGSFCLYTMNRHEMDPYFANLKMYMQKYGFEDYYEYFTILARSSKLSDEQKIETEFVMIPFFKQLSQKSAKEKNRAFKECCNNTNQSNYPVARLLASAFYNIDGINLNKNYCYYDWRTVNHFPFNHAIINKDYALIKKLLHTKASPDVHDLHILIDSRSYSICNNLRYKKILNLLFQQSAPFRSLNIDQKFGKYWFYIVAARLSSNHFDLSINRITALLHHNCYFDDKCRSRILNKIRSACPPLPAHLSDQEKIEQQEQFRRKAKLDIINIVNKDHASRKNILFGLHQRALTGKPLQNMKVHLNHCYERALAQ